MPCGDGVLAKFGGGGHGGHIVLTVGLQPLPASISPAISPIPGAFQDSGKAMPLGEHHRQRQKRWDG